MGVFSRKPSCFLPFVHICLWFSLWSMSFPGFFQVNWENQDDTIFYGFIYGFSMVSLCFFQVFGGSVDQLLSVARPGCWYIGRSQRASLLGLGPRICEHRCCDTNPSGLMIRLSFNVERDISIYLFVCLFVCLSIYRYVCIIMYDIYIIYIYTYCIL